MPYCRSCGALHPEGAGFCPACGEPTGSAGPASAQYSGFWRRAGGSFIDGLVVGVPVVGAALVAWLGFGYTFGLHLGRDAFGHRTVVGGPSARAQALIQLVSYLPGWLYNALLQSGPRQATLGQRAVGIKVTDMDGNRIGFARATGRYFAALISTYTLLIGYLMMLWTKRKQCLHDKIADTLVVRSDT